MIRKLGLTLLRGCPTYCWLPVQPSNSSWKLAGPSRAVLNRRHRPDNKMGCCWGRQAALRTVLQAVELPAGIADLRAARRGSARDEIWGKRTFSGKAVRVRAGAKQLALFCQWRTALRQPHLDTSLADVDGDNLTHGGWCGWNGGRGLVWKVDVGLRTRLLSH